MLHQLHHYAETGRPRDFRLDRGTAQLKRAGYRDYREPRITRHWANR